MNDITVEMHATCANMVKVKVEFEMGTMAFDGIDFWNLADVQRLIAEWVAAGNLKSLTNIPYRDAR